VLASNETLKGPVATVTGREEAVCNKHIAKSSNTIPIFICDMYGMPDKNSLCLDCSLVQDPGKS
jgi:hypothetical protein